MEGKVKIRIDAKGDCHIEVNGVEGSSCEDLTRALIQNMGDVEEQTYTEEYHQDLPDRIDIYDGEE